jgi:hypothetical protein
MPSFSSKEFITSRESPAIRRFDRVSVRGNALLTATDVSDLLLA